MINASPNGLELNVKLQFATADVTMEDLVSLQDNVNVLVVGPVPIAINVLSDGLVPVATLQSVKEDVGMDLVSPQINANVNLVGQLHHVALALQDGLVKLARADNVASNVEDLDNCVLLAAAISKILVILAKEVDKSIHWM